MPGTVFGIRLLSGPQFPFMTNGDKAMSPVGQVNEVMEHGLCDPGPRLTDVTSRVLMQNRAPHLMGSGAVSSCHGNCRISGRSHETPSYPSGSSLR